MLIRNDSVLTIIRFTLSYHNLYLHITQLISLLFASTENRRTRSFSSIDTSDPGHTYSNDSLKSLLLLYKISTSVLLEGVDHLLMP